MHNRKKLSRNLSQDEISDLQSRSHQYAVLVDTIFKRRKLEIFDSETFNLVGKMLKVNPDFYSLWNFRRELLHILYPAVFLIKHQTMLDADIVRVRDLELKLTKEAIQKNPKSYGAWYHRRWILDYVSVDLSSEFDLCRELLRKDQRNFHCWNYRRFLQQRFNSSTPSEIAYSTEKIVENFSNYSAFHHRAVFISISWPVLLEESLALLRQELKIVENAIFTEPDDQSSWWYHQYLCRSLVQGVFPIAESESISIMVEQVELISTLLEVEGGCSRWALNSIIYLIDLIIFDTVLSTNLKQSHIPTLKRFQNLRSACLENLLTLDPVHQNRYKWLQQKAFIFRSLLDETSTERD